MSNIEKPLNTSDTSDKEATTPSKTVKKIGLVIIAIIVIALIINNPIFFIIYYNNLPDSELAYNERDTKKEILKFYYHWAIACIVLAFVPLVLFAIFYMLGLFKNNLFKKILSVVSLICYIIIGLFCRMSLFHNHLPTIFLGFISLIFSIVVIAFCLLYIAPIILKI
jgi:hypothetical protein